MLPTAILPNSNRRAASTLSVGGRFRDFAAARICRRTKAGVPACAYILSESGVGSSVGSVHHEAHEVGHCLGLGHTLDGDHFGDTLDGSRWLQAGSVMCGNLKIAVVVGRTLAPDRSNNESYSRRQLGRAHNSFSPPQLGRMILELDHFLNRYPLVACQPIKAYDANRVQCESAESLALCEQTVSGLKARTDTAHQCQPSGSVTREMARVLQSPDALYFLNKSAEGQRLVMRLAGRARRANHGRKNARGVRGARVWRQPGFSDKNTTLCRE